MKLLRQIPVPFFALACYGAVMHPLLTPHPATSTKARPVVPPQSPPVDFIENRGQWDAAIKFAANKGAMSAAFERDALTLRVSDRETTASVRLVFEGASAQSDVIGEHKRAGVYNYFFGNDAKQWHSNVGAFTSVLYHRLYDGVDARVREDNGRLEYDLLVAPEAKIDNVILRAEGTSDIAVAEDGALILTANGKSLRQSPPKTWQELPDGSRRMVECRFRKIDNQHYGFEVPQHDRRLAMTIDPGLEWSTFLGGGANETVTGMALARDGSGDVILCGQTYSADFPHTNGHHAPVGMTPYVARLNASGSALVYCTFFGGAFNHSVLDLAVDGQSQPVVVGDTNSLDFPVTPGAY
ncbi:MAG TPA: hypothetical protein VF511_07160, partial [Chthoniobacterales bacterium]